MMGWSEFVRLLGEAESVENIRMLTLGVGEDPVVSSGPGEIGDSSFKTSFYQFFKKGVEVGFRGGVLNHIHFFAQAHEGYSAYAGDIFGREAAGLNDVDINNMLGPAVQFGGDKQDMLIGYIRPWCKYGFDNYAVRFEFSRSKDVWKVTLMLA